MTTKEKDAFYTVAYDLPSEYLSLCIDNPKEDHDLRLKKTKTRSQISKVRHTVRNNILRYGRFVNNSVFVIPKCSIDKVRKVVEKADKDYVALNEIIAEDYGTTLEYDITVLAFDTGESVRLRGKAKKSLIKELDKVCDKLDGRINKLSTKGKGTTEASIKTAHNGLAEVEDVIAKFKLDKDPEIEQMVKLVSLKIQDLGNLKTASQTKP